MTLAHKFCYSIRIRQLMSFTQTSYALLIMSNDRIFAVRDPYGNRPLCLGKIGISSIIENGMLIITIYLLHFYFFIIV